MKNLLEQIQLLLEQSSSPENSKASKEIKDYSEKLQDDIDAGDFHAKKKKKQVSGQKEEDLNALSKKDLDKKEDEVEDSPEDENVPTPDESPSTINLADAMSFENLIDTLNQFRAAQSFTDKKVSAGLKNYFNKLEENEKKVLHVFIKGLIQVTMLNVDGNAAYAPSDLMFNISKTGSASSEKKKSQQRKIDAKEKAKASETKPIVTVGPK
jgi:hypothetical protein